MNHERAIGRQRLRRRRRVRRRIRGTPERPRLSVFRSHKHVYAQIIDDLAGRTLVSCSTQEPALAGQVKYGGNREAAQQVGKVLAQRALEAGFKEVCFDRREYRYHGRVAALADAAREAGLSF